MTLPRWCGSLELIGTALLFAFVGLAHGQDSLEAQLGQLDEMRAGPQTPFEEVEQRSQELLQEYEAEEEQGLIYAHMYAQSGMSDEGRAEEARRYAAKALEYPLIAEKRLRMYIYLGDGLQSTDRTEPFPVRRKRAAEAYLKGLKEALLCGAPLERPEYVLPPMPSGEGGMGTFGEGLPGPTVPGGMVSFEEGKRLSELVGDQAAKSAEVRRLQELHLCRWALFTQLIDMYGRREPHGASELRQMATEIVGDQEVIASLMKQLEERGALKDDLVERPSGEVSLEHVQARVDGVRSGLAQKSLDELVVLLNDNLGYMRPGYYSPRRGDDEDFEQILSNRLTSRLLDALKELPRDEARVDAESMCNRMHRECEATIERVLNHYENPGAPENTQSMSGNRLGLGTAIFLLAHFSDTDAVVREVRRMGDCTNRFRERVARNRESYPPDFEKLVPLFWDLDVLCQINLIAFAVEKSAAEQPSRQSRVKEVLASVPTKTVVWTNWNARVSYYDIAHRTHGRPIDEEHGVEELIVYRWTADMLMKEEEQQEILTALLEIFGDES